MSVVASLRRRASFVLLGVLASLCLSGLVGCGGDEEVDPYVYASLQDVMSGTVLDTLSRDFTFEIDAPAFEFVRGNTAIVRDGNMLEFLVGPDLENRYQSYRGSLLGVQKFFRPTSHLVVKRVKRAGVIDTLDTVTDFIMPKVLTDNAVDIKIPGAPLPDLGWNDRSNFATFLPDEKGNEKQFQTAIERFVFVPKHTLPDSVQANPTAKDMAWYAVFENSTLEIVDLMPGAEWMLHLLLEKDLPLVGCFSVLELVDSYRDRRVEYGDLGHVIGTVKINWFRYANKYIKGTPDV
ncbi:MAG: hypothetical protein ABIF77_14960 [bacterium]